MRNSTLFYFFVGVGLFLSSCSEKNNLELDGWDLVWHDEFEKDGVPNSEFWSFEKGFVRNKELQWYQQENAYCKDGLLIIEGRKELVNNDKYDPLSTHWKENRPTAKYTSASLKTINKKEFLYGRFEVKARIPISDGVWPAIWTLGQQKEWPSCGEIDIMEFYKINNESHILANAAWGTNKKFKAKWNSKKIPFSYFLEKNSKWADEFHIWKMEWDQELISLYLDDELVNEIKLSETVNDSIGGYLNPFKTPHYILLNLALGGNGGEIDENAFPVKYEIDYVRVYQKKKEQHKEFLPGEIWTDSDGKHINAHGGGILFYKDVYYWYGEHKTEHSNNALDGVQVYSSKDLYNWKNEGIALAVMPEGSGHIIEKGCIIERPKVIYNKETDNYVMWFHLEHKGKGYKAAEYGVAESKSPIGPFKFLYSSRACQKLWPFDMTEQEITIAKASSQKELTKENKKEEVIKGAFLARDIETGQMARDMTLFVDDDGKAYHIYSSEENQTLHLAELTDDYLYHTGKYTRIAPGGHNEAPAILKKDDIYWMITSGCTGWEPNEARLLTAKDIWGPWTQLHNPCKGDGANKTFKSQSTFILPVAGKNDSWIFMADRWTPKNPINGRYIWLPLRFDDGYPTLEWMDKWCLNEFEN